MTAGEFPISLDRLRALVDRFPTQTIGLVGDLFLDRYLHVDFEFAEKSVETGLEAWQITRIRNSPGALGTVMNNLAALGAGRLVPVSVVGDDGQAYDLLTCLARLGADVGHVVRAPERLTPTYTKPLRRDDRGAWRELNRLDFRNREALSAPVEKELLRHLDAVFAECDGLIVGDQVWEEGWGVVNARVRARLEEFARRDAGKLILVDSRARAGSFRRCVLKPNARECLLAVDPGANPEQIADLDVVKRACIELSSRTESIVYCTRSEHGMVLVMPGQAPRVVPGVPVTGPVDPVGAGDSATAGIAAALLAGATHFEAAQVGNLVASITVEQLGTTGSATPARLIERATALGR
jgi:rfaE bifunctional protein kinase chain/domain